MGVAHSSGICGAAVAELIDTVIVYETPIMCFPGRFRAPYPSICSWRLARSACWRSRELPRLFRNL